MLKDELGALRKNLVQLVEGAGKKRGLGSVVARKRMGSFDNPLDVIVDMLKELGAITLFEALNKLRTNCSSRAIGYEHQRAIWFSKITLVPGRSSGLVITA